MTYLVHWPSKGELLASEMSQTAWCVSWTWSCCLPQGSLDSSKGATVWVLQPPHGRSIYTETSPTCNVTWYNVATYRVVLWRTIILYHVGVRIRDEGLLIHPLFFLVGVFTLNGWMKQILKLVKLLALIRS